MATTSIPGNVEVQFFAQPDPRVADWLLMDGPRDVIIIALAYVVVVKFLGPFLMRNRKPYNLKNVIKVYNCVQIISCGTLLYKLFSVHDSFGFSHSCQTIVTDEKLMNYYWWTMMLKLFELVETVFFIMRKKNSQVSKLHVYHHASTFLYVWIGTKYSTGGFMTFYLILNHAVHVFMYTYYTLAALDSPRITAVANKVKRYITIIQMVQFTAMILYTSRVLSPSCSVPKILPLIFVPNVLLVYYMFWQFYKNSYSKKKV